MGWGKRSRSNIVGATRYGKSNGAAEHGSTTSKPKPAIPLTGSGSSLTIGGDWTHKSSFYHSSCNPLPSQEDGYDLFNAQVGFDSADGRWRVAAQFRNVSDEDYAAGQFFIPGLGFDAVYFNPPRTWALTVRYSFD